MEKNRTIEMKLYIESSLNQLRFASNKRCLISHSSTNFLGELIKRFKHNLKRNERE